MSLALRRTPPAWVCPGSMPPAARHNVRFNVTGHLWVWYGLAIKKGTRKTVLKLSFWGPEWYGQL